MRIYDERKSAKPTDKDMRAYVAEMRKASSDLWRQGDREGSDYYARLAEYGQRHGRYAPKRVTDSWFKK